MKYVAAYLLLGLAGKPHPTAKEVENMLESVGVEVNKEKLNKVIEELKGKNIEDIVKEGTEKLAFLSLNPSSDIGEEAEDGEKKVEEVVEAVKEPEPEESEESDDDLGFGLFD